MAQLIPVSNSPNQSLTVNLTVNGNSLQLSLFIYYNTSGNPPFWAMNIADQFNNPLISSVPLVTGVWPAANILGPFDYMGVGSAYVIDQAASALDIPDSQSLGNSFVVIWDDNPSYSAGDNTTP